jgi:hypothetical protein
VAALVAAVAWWRGGDNAAAPVQAASSAPASQAPHMLGAIGQVQGLELPTGRAGQLVQLKEHLQQVDQTYCHYAAGTKYPNASRPITEHPDQVYPNLPVTEAHPMRTGNGRTDPSIQIQTSQSRVYMAAGEQAAFSLRAIDADGKSLPLVVSRALAQGMTNQGARATTQVTLPFADEGAGADAVSGDGAFAGVLAPSQTGLASFNGTIRTEVQYAVAGKKGFVLFDVIYTPELPATWSGKVSEAVEDGSLVFKLKADVRIAGRYIVTGRVDDAKGKPFALATFNDLLPSGPAEVKLLVFGKLMRDGEAALPLTLRDVEGYLLKEDMDPDRALMPRLEGKVFVGKPHALKAFSEEEWQSEERSRHLTEFSKDVTLARQALNQFDPTLPPPKSACLP